MASGSASAAGAPESNEVVDFSFEGPEKLLEIWFRPTESTGGPRGLHQLSRAVWERLLDLVHCTIISTIENENVHAYLLSESSLFVWPFKMILKTCGTTTLLRGIAEILKVASSIGLTQVDGIYYSRQSYFFPEKQLEPHSSFLDEVHYMDKYFHRGAAYVVGKLNGNHFNFYTSTSTSREIVQNQEVPDCTLEMLMTDLSRDCAQRFYAENGNTAERASLESGIAALIPGAKLDAFLFSPYGYSANGIKGDEYFTIHITPQASCSFASFETNVRMDDYTPLIEAVLKVFQPGRFILTTIANGAAIRNFSRHRSGFDASAFSLSLAEQFGFSAACTPIGNTANHSAASFGEIPAAPQPEGPLYHQLDDIAYTFDVYNLSFVQFQLRSALPPASDGNVARPGVPPSLEEVEKQVELEHGPADKDAPRKDCLNDLE